MITLTVEKESRGRVNTNARELMGLDHSGDGKGSTALISCRWKVSKIAVPLVEKTVVLNIWADLWPLSDRNDRVISDVMDESEEADFW